MRHTSYTIVIVRKCVTIRVDTKQWLRVKKRWLRCMFLSYLLIVVECVVQIDGPRLDEQPSDEQRQSDQQQTRVQLNGMCPN